MDSKYAFLSCNWAGMITEIFYSEYNHPKIRVGNSLIDIFHYGCCEKLNNFLTALKSNSFVYGWEMNLKVNGNVVTTNLSGALIDGKIIVTLAEKGNQLLKYYDEMLRINNAQVNRIRELERQIIIRNKEQENYQLDQFTKLNNELINTRRELEKKNIQLQTLNTKLKMISVTDELTSLYNRRHFFEIIKDVCNRANRLNIPVSLLSIDINSFKLVNDTYGHTEGDRLLIELANILQKHTRSGLDYAFRFGGDEFLLLLTDSNKEKALIIAKRIDNEFQNFTDIASLAYGAVGLNLCEEDVSKMIQEADIKMYEHKRKLKEDKKKEMQ